MLSLHDVSIGFRVYRGFRRQSEHTHLSHLTMELHAGEILAIIGASGVGKSLLAHALLGLLPANAVLRGEARFRGQLLTGAYPAALRGRHIALMPQRVSHLDPLATVGRQLGWASRRTSRRGTRLAGSRDDIAQRLAALHLDPGVLGLYPHQLSGGMARRVMLAMATAGDPDLLIADEPTVGLDPENRDLVLHLLGARARRGGAVILITHDLRAALPFADRVAILNDGRISGPERAADFRGEGAELRSPDARAMWRALPEHGFNADA